MPDAHLPKPTQEDQKQPAQGKKSVQPANLAHGSKDNHKPSDATSIGQSPEIDGQQSDTPPPEISFDPLADRMEEQSDEDAAKSDDELQEHGKTIKDFQPLTPSTMSASSATTPLSSLSAPSSTGPSYAIDATNGEYLVQLSIEIRPNAEHMDTVLEGVKSFLKVLRSEDPTGCLLPRFNDPARPLPPLTGADNEDFPHDYLRANKYIKVSNVWMLSQPPIDKSTLRSRLSTMQESIKSRTKKQSSKKAPKKSGGPVALYVNVKIKTDIHPSLISEIITGVDITLYCSKRVRVSLKQLQCWDSSPKYALLGVNNGVDPHGVEATLMHHLKTIERKLCRSGRLKMEEYYDFDLPKVHVYVKKLRELSIPDDEREHLSFATFAAHCQLVFHIEANEEAWTRLEPLMDIFVRGNGILRVFGPIAHLMALPGSGKTSLTETRVYHSKGRIGMAYNAGTAVYDCAEVMNYDLEVKVKMAAQKVVDEEGRDTGELKAPPAPYKRTTLRKEMANVTLNGNRVFHSAIMTRAGPDVGISRVTVPYDPRNPACQEVQTFTKHTLANLACFFYHWWTHEAGYHESTVKRLMTSFYFDRHVTADESSWDPATKRATSRYASAADTWLEDHRHLDPISNQTKKFTFKTTDAERSSLLSKLNYKENQAMDDIQSGPSAITGDDQSSGASSLRSETSEGLAMGRTTALKMKLARVNSALADRDAALKKMQDQLSRLMEAQRLCVSQPDNMSIGSGPPRETEGPQGP
jgi:hypothetical protein